MKQIDRIRKFSDAFGPSGFEDAVVAACTQEEVREICRCKEDHMRNLYMNLKGNSQGGVNIMLDAHSDEVGFIVPGGEKATGSCSFCRWAAGM